METAWYFRLFFVNIGCFIVSWLLFYIIKAKRMSGPGLSKRLIMMFWLIIIMGWILSWFITYSINVPFWLGLGIIIFGFVIYTLGYMAMREHPEKKQAVVDWGIYGISRNSHMLAGMICLLGVVVMAWNPSSILYIVLWVYYVVYVALMHFGVISEEKLNMERFGQEYIEYMERVPRYLFGRM